MGSRYGDQPGVPPKNLVFTEAADCLESINGNNKGSPVEENDMWIGSPLGVATFSECSME